MYKLDIPSVVVGARNFKDNRYYYMALSHKDWELPNSRVWLAEIDIDRGLDFPIRQKWKTCLLFMQFDKTVCLLLCVKSSKFFGRLFRFIYSFTRLDLKHFIQLKYFLYFLLLTLLYLYTTVISNMLLWWFDFA